MVSLSIIMINEQFNIKLKFGPLRISCQVMLVIFGATLYLV